MKHIPKRYIPKGLTIKDKIKQSKELIKSKKLYKKGKYYTRKNIKSHKSKTSQHILNARRIYNIENIRPSKELSEKTGCSISALKQIEKKGMGAYFSSGSRPNQTAQSWGRARLASAITGGNSSIIDYNIIDNQCKKNKLAYKLATKKLKKQGNRRTIRKAHKTKLIYK